MEYDRILTSRPVSAQAAKQLGGGVHWEPQVKIQDYFETLPPMKPSSFAAEKSRTSDVGWRDFTGQVFGRLSVIGLMAKEADSPSSWVCRCKCGYFCSRKTKSLKAANVVGSGFVDRCGRCHYQQKLREGWTPTAKLPVQP